MKLVVIGLDGASFELIDPWIKEGILPNIARIKQDGVWADMESVLPPVTSPNWKCYSTGKNPGKLGIFWWENIDWRKRKIYYPAARKPEHKEIWDYMGAAGMKVGILGMPTTYPPKKVNGFLVAGGEAEEKNFTYPAELENELKQHGWRHHPRVMIDVDRQQATRDIYEIIDANFNMAKILGQRYEVDFLQATCFVVNLLHHFIWDSPETRKGWEIIDKHIGKFISQDYHLLIMSDHGSNRIKSVFNINCWLKKEGYLSLNYSPSATLHDLGINRRNLAILAARLKISGLLRTLTAKIFRLSPDMLGLSFEMSAKTGRINWQKSKAVATGQGPVYLNPENHDNETLKKEMKRRLEALLDPLTGERIINQVYFKEEVYHGKYFAEAPDLIVGQARGTHIHGGMTEKRVFDRPQRWQGENKRTGLFMAYGPDIEHGKQIDNVSILDLAPTILHLMNIPVPDDMDGRVLTGIFVPDSPLRKREVVYQKAADETEKEKERIRSRARKLSA